MKLLKSLVVMLLLVASGFAEKVTTIPAPTAYVDDYAGVMTEAGKAEVEAICREVHDKTKAQIFFVTVRSLEDESIETFSNDLFHKWKIGEKKTNRGILVLLAVADHKRRIEVGYGLEGIIPDGKAGDIGRDMVPALKASDYDQAAKISVREIAAIIAADSKATIDSLAVQAHDEEASTPAEAAPASSDIDGRLRWIGPLFFLCFFGIFGLVIWASIRNHARTGSWGGGSGNDGFGGSSGGDSGGSSDSFGGGDGGDSGGGGASGSW